MGADIYGIIEKKMPNEEWSPAGELDIVRNDVAFGVLGYRYAEKSIKPLSKDRGCPKNASIPTKAFCQHDFGYGTPENISYFTLKELIEYDTRELVQNPDVNVKKEALYFFIMDYRDLIEQMSELGEPVDNVRCIYFFVG